MPKPSTSTSVTAFLQKKFLQVHELSEMVRIVVANDDCFSKERLTFTAFNRFEEIVFGCSD
jgi:hypothetical protein